MSAAYELTIKPRKGWQPIDLQELWVFRELLGFLVWRDIKVRYKQTILGGLWAILQPLIGTIIFGVLFSKVAPIKTTAPYILFVYAGLVPWTFFANSLSMSSNSLIGSEQMIRKTYLPRVFLPLGAILALVLDMLIGFALMSVLLVYYHYQVTAAFALAASANARLLFRGRRNGADALGTECSVPRCQIRGPVLYADGVFFDACDLPFELRSSEAQNLPCLEPDGWNDRGI